MSIIINHKFLLYKLKYYNSREIFIKYKTLLTPQFCFNYLYNNEQLTHRVYYNEIINRFIDKYTMEELIHIYDIVMFNKDSDVKVKHIYTLFCNKECNECTNTLYCF